MARRAPLKATGEPRALTFNTSELLQTGGASPGWAWKRSGRRLIGTVGRPGEKLLSEHIEVESGKNNDRQQLQPCHLARLARNQVRFGLRQAAQCGGAAANASGERRPGQAAASEPSQAPPGLAGIGQRPAGSPRPLGSFRRPKQYGRTGRAGWVVGGPENCLLLLRSTGWMRRRREMMPGGETPTPRRGRISGREMRARRKTSAATLRKRGGGVSESRRGSLCNLDMVSCADFFSAA